MPAIQHFILATAGHVDHGKSSVVRTLTGVDTDRLPEEKARGITIDLGFASLELQSGDTTYRLGIVDVPGHEDFVKNMVAGVGSIDLALLIVAADDGWMPQTEEHLQILSHLGVRRGVVALTKADLAPDLDAAINALRERLAGTALADAPIVPTSIITKTGFDELKDAMRALLKDSPPPASIGKPRLNVDRVFTLKGIGTVVTGTLTGGEVRKNQGVILQPSGRKTRVRTLQSHNREVDASQPGTRTALNLADIPAEQVHRGEVITLPEFGGPVDAVDVLVTKSTRLAGLKSPAANPLKDGTRLRFHHGSGNWPARLFFHGRKELAPGESAVAEVRFESPAYVFANDRFILRDWPEQFTLAGGLVLDPEANRRRFRGEKQQAYLTARAAQPADLSATLLALLQRSGLTDRRSLLLKSPFAAAHVAAAVDELVRAGKVFAAGELVGAATLWQELKDRAAKVVDAHHRAHPEQLTCPLNDVRAALEKHLPVAESFNALIADLCRDGFAAQGTGVRDTRHRPALPPQLQGAGDQVRAALAAKPFEPPSRKELAPDQLTQQALRFLRDTGEVVDLSPEIVLLADSYEKMRAIIVDHLRRHGGGTVSEFRQATGSTRRIMVPLLEKLDRDGVTKRDGDRRALGKNA